MLQKAKERGFAPEYVLILKLVASFGWFFLTRLKSNRLVNSDGVGNRPSGGASGASSGLWVCPSVSDGLK